MATAGVMVWAPNPECDEIKEKLKRKQKQLFNQIFNAAVFTS